MAAAAATILRGSWRSKTASELREIGDKSLILSPILVFEHELSRIERIGTMKPRETIEEYKHRISDLIDEAEEAIGYRIDSVEVYPKQGLMNKRGVRFNIQL